MLAFRVGGARSEEVTLTFATLTPPEYSTNTRVHTPPGGGKLRDTYRKLLGAVKAGP